MQFISEDFRVHYISSYTLFVKSGYVRDTLTVLDEQKNILVHMVYPVQELPDSAARLLSYPFGGVVVVVPQQNVVWVPLELYDEQDKSMYCDYLNEDNVDAIFVKPIVSLGITSLYTVDPILMNRWRHLFEFVAFVPEFEPVLLQSSVQVAPLGNEIGVHIHDEKADIFVYNDGNLLLYNTFEVVTPDDLSYFLLCVYEQFKVDNQDRIWLSGASLDSEWAGRLSRYATHIELLKPQDTWFVTDDAVKRNLMAMNVVLDSGLCV